MSPIFPENRVVDCFTNVPIQKDLAVGTMDSMDALIDLYSFTDISKDSGAPYNLKVDLRGEAKRIRDKISSGYVSDYEFQTDLLNLMGPLNDAHTLYMAPAGYRCFMTRAFNLEASVDSTKTKMVYTLREGPLGALTSLIWQMIFGVDVSSYMNQVVVGINGVSPTDHVMGIAEHFVSTYKDHGVRFNAALRGRWSQTLLSLFPATSPYLDHQMVLTMADGRTLTVPNAGFCPGGIQSTRKLLAANGATLSGAAQSVNRMEIARKVSEFMEGQHRTVGMDIHRESERIFQEAVRISGLDVTPSPRPAPSRQPTPVVAYDYRTHKKSVGDEFHVVNKEHTKIAKAIGENFDPAALRLVKSSTAYDTAFMIYDDHQHPVHYILKLTTFVPNSTDETLAVINEMVSSAQQNQVKHLIADVAFNGGGIVCLADLLVAMLVPTWGDLNPVGKSGPLPLGIYDYRQSPTTDMIRSNSFLNDFFTTYRNYLDVDTNGAANATFWSPVQRQRGGMTSAYTEQAYFPAACTAYPSPWFQPVRYYFSHIDVVTDGTCGSACALFASQLQSFKYARVVSYGGPMGREVPLSTASFAGGNVFEYSMVAGISWLFGGGQKGLPPLIPSTASARFNFNEYYEHDKLETPREFLKRPADVHLDFYATLYESAVQTPLGLSNNARLYSAIIDLGE